MFKALKNLFSSKDSKNSLEKAAEVALKNQMTQMIPDMVRTQSIDPDENIKTPKSAEISYLDAQALKFWDGKRTDYQIPQYYSENAFGRNVGPALPRLLKGGYLELSDIVKNISLKTVPELKAILAEHELKVSGKKGELVHRLMDNLPDYELKELFSTGIYTITEKGQSALKPYSIISTNDQHGLGFSYYRLLSEREKSPHDSDEDILIRLLSREIQECYQEGDQARYQTAITKAARFMSEIGETQKALECYILSFFVFAMQIKQYPQLNTGGQSYYLATHLEQCGKIENYSFEQLTDKIRKTIEKDRPFALATKANINFTIDLFKKSLSM